MEKEQRNAYAILQITELKCLDDHLMLQARLSKETSSVRRKNLYLTFSNKSFSTNAEYKVYDLQNVTFTQTLPASTSSL